MSITLGDAIVYLSADPGGLDGGLRKADSKVKKFAGGIQNVLGAALKTGLIGAGVAVGAGMAYLTKSVLDASDTFEMLSKEQVTFGESTKKVQDDLNTFADAVGRSKYELQTMATDQGAVLKGMGFTDDQAAQLSTTMTQLAVDVGSFNNLPSEDVANRFSRALTGEFESLKALGIVVNQNRIDQELANRGITESWQNLDQYTRANIIASMIQESAADAQGDAARTAGSFANQMVALKAKLKDTTTEIGLKLLPVVTPLLQQFGDMAKVVLPRLVDGFETYLLPIIEKVFWVLGAIADAGFGSMEMWEALSGILGDDLTRSLQDVVGWLSSLTDGFSNPELAGKVQEIMDLLGPLVRDILEKMAPVVKKIVDKFKEMAEMAAPVILDNVKESLQSISEWWNGSGGDAFRTVVEWVEKIGGATIIGGVTLLTGLVNALLRLANGDVAGAVEAIRTSFENFMNTTLSLVDTDLPHFVEQWRSNFDMAKIIVSEVGTRIGETIGKGLEDINKKIEDFWGWIKKVGEQLKHLVIPDFLQHHSPAPLAVAFQEIGQEVKKVMSPGGLPAFGKQMQGMGLPGPNQTFDYSRKLQVDTINVNNGRGEQALLNLFRNAAGV